MADRSWNAIDARLYEEDWSPSAKLIAGVVLARCPNTYGVFDVPIWFLSTLFQGLYTRSEIEAAMVEWEASHFASFYRDRTVIWIRKKWKRQGKPSDLHWKGLHRHLEGFPEVREDFLAYYIPPAVGPETPPKGIETPLKGDTMGIEAPLLPLVNPDSESGTEAEEPSVLNTRVGELLPNREFTPAAMKKQATALRLLMDSDRKKVDNSFSKADWPEHVLSILRYMRDDTETRGDWKGWSKVFISIPRLREEDCAKFINARNSFLSRKQGFDRKDLDDDSKFEETKEITL